MTVEALPAPRANPVWGFFFVLVLGVLVFINGLFWIHTIPDGSAPDEVNHARIMAFLSDNHRLPVLNKDIYLQPLPVVPDPYVTHPPGGYIVGAIVAQFLPKPITVISFRYGSLACLLLAIPFFFLSVRRLFPNNFAMQAGVTCFCVAIPQVTFVGAYASSDAFGMLAGAIFIWATIAGVQSRWTLGRTAVWGATVGIMLLGRYNGYILLPVFALVGLITQRRDPIGRIILRGAIAGLLALFVAGWWLAFNYHQYHELLPIRTLWNAQTAVLGHPYQTPRDRGETYWSLLTHSIWLSSTFRSFWGNFDWLDLPLPEWAYFLLRWATAISWVGLIIGAVRKYLAWRENRDDAVRGRVLLITSFLVAAMALILFALYFALTVDFQGQGRYLFPGLLAICLLMICGWREFFPGGAKVFVAPVVAALFVALNIFTLIFDVRPFYVPLSPTSLIPQLQPLQDGIDTRIVHIYRGHQWDWGFFEQSPHSVEIAAPVRDAVLTLRIGVLPEAYDKCPAVRFIISVEDKGTWKPLFDRTIHPMDNKADRSWRSVKIDMSSYVNQTTELRFAVDPAGDTAYDWAVWLDPCWMSKTAAF